MLAQEVDTSLHSSIPPPFLHEALHLTLFPFLPSFPSSLSPPPPPPQVNGINMVNATHAESVAALKSVTTSCQLVVSREVLVVLPDEAAKEGGDEVGQPPALPAAIEEGEEGGGSESEVVAKQMVADVLDRSLNR